MIRRIAVLALALALCGAAAWAELSYSTVAAVATSQTVTINASTLTVVNDGSNEVYVRVFWEGETAAAATTANAEIKSGESLTFTRQLSIKAISIICASGETATVRLFYW